MVRLFRIIGSSDPERKHPHDESLHKSPARPTNRSQAPHVQTAVSQVISWRAAHDLARPRVHESSGLRLISLPCSSTAVQAEWYTFLTLKALNAGLYFKHEAYINEQEYKFLEAHPIVQPVPGVK